MGVMGIFDGDFLFSPKYLLKKKKIYISIKRWGIWYKNP